MGFIGDLYRIYMGFILDLYGIYRGFILDLYWIYMGFIWDLEGIYMGFIWDLYGIYRGSSWKTHWLNPPSWKNMRTSSNWENHLPQKVLGWKFQKIVELPAPRFTSNLIKFTSLLGTFSSWLLLVWYTSYLSPEFFFQPKPFAVGTRSWNPCSVIFQ